MNLTPRQKQFLSLTVTGLQKKQIAYLLGISESTIRATLDILYKKVGAHSQGHALFKCLDSGLLTLDEIKQHALSIPGSTRRSLD